MVAVLRVFAYALPADALDEMFGISETVVYDSIEHFVDAIDQLFGHDYLRHPDVDDVSRLLETNAGRGFIGMLFSIDCMHWEWKNCPAELSGQFKGKENKSIVVLEACADGELWI